jgi:hypothetical protein
MSYLWGFVTVVDSMVVINFDAIKILIQANADLLLILVSLLALIGANSVIRKYKRKGKK